MKVVNEIDLHALIRLVDDPDESVYTQVRNTIMEFGSDAIPFLENSLDNLDYELIFHERIQRIVQDIHFEEIKRKLVQWSHSSDKDLIEGALIVANYQYKDLDDTSVYTFIDQLKRSIWLELNDHQTAFEKVKIINRVFFDLFHFQGDTKNYHLPSNSFINDVIDFKKGNPLSLSILYSQIAQSLGVPIYGVNLPNHFILAFMDENGSNHYLSSHDEFGVLFYINPFSKGSILDSSAIKDFLKGLQLPFERDYFEPCSNTTVIRRMITNLIGAFQQVGNSKKVSELDELRKVLD